MTENFEIKQIKCPNCGGELNSVGPFSTTKKCIYCHKEFEVTGTMNKKVDLPERIVVFNTTRDDFEREILSFLVQGDYTPNDIFNYAQFRDVEGIYLPMYLYEGKYDATWNCSVGYYENEVVATFDNKGVKNKRVIKYRPQSGSTKNNFAIVCIAYEGKDVKKELVEYARTYVYDSLSAKAFSPDLLSGYQFMIHNLDKETTWDKWGVNTVKYLAERNSLSQIPGEKYKDFTCGVSVDTKHDGRLVYLPFWSIYYEYNNEVHHAILDGTGKNRITGSIPIDVKRKQSVDIWYTVTGYLKWIRWVSLAGFLNHNFNFLPFLVWIAYFALKFYAGINKKMIVSKNKKIREQKLAELLKANG